MQRLKHTGKILLLGTYLSVSVINPSFASLQRDVSDGENYYSYANQYGGYASQGWHDASSFFSSLTKTPKEKVFMGEDGHMYRQSVTAGNRRLK